MSVKAEWAKKFTTNKGKFTADFEHFHNNRNELRKWFPNATIYYWHELSKGYRKINVL
jgi:hypothetical protein